MVAEITESTFFVRTCTGGLHVVFQHGQRLVAQRPLLDRRSVNAVRHRPQSFSRQLLFADVLSGLLLLRLDVGSHFGFYPAGLSAGYYSFIHFSNLNTIVNPLPNKILSKLCRDEISFCSL